MVCSPRACLQIGFWFLTLSFSAAADQEKGPAVRRGRLTPVDSVNPTEPSPLETKLSALEEKLSALEKGSASVREDLDQVLDATDKISDTLDEISSRLDSLDQKSRAVAASGASIGVADKVHVFIVADTRRADAQGQLNAIAPGARANITLMTNLLRNACLDARDSGTNHLTNSGVKVLQDRDFSFQNLKQALNAATVGPNDVVFVYIACHGSTDTSNRHYFAMPNPIQSGEVLARSQVWSMMKGKMARQTILISDTCSNKTNAVAIAVPAPMDRDLPTGAFSRLLLYQIGDVDLSGSSRPPEDNGVGGKFAGQGQFGVYATDGGFFTKSFCFAANRTPLPVSWGKLMRESQKKLSEEFRGGVRMNVFGTTVTVTKQTIERVDD